MSGELIDLLHAVKDLQVDVMIVAIFPEILLLKLKVFLCLRAALAENRCRTFFKLTPIPEK